ncbi:unnamed protein product [Paramecium sonneborni]|uniref:Pre-mRNA polyadenylation factor Fip1 domain-containing protein n=1 Tax=Paramecium sonneborni TaxID=65129 RepID=A0A8S1LLC0_9CILI|nr:unnamed protein product [Paramecium sonneborni]
MNIREKLLRVKQSAPLYKLQTPQVLKEEYLNANSKKWLTKGIDITDYFNYGFNDATLKLYIQKLNKLTDLNLSKLQKEYTARMTEQKELVFKDNIPMDYGGLGITSVSECLPQELEGQKESFIFKNIDLEDFKGDFIFTNETILDIFSHYKLYLEQLITKCDCFDFDLVMQHSQEENKWQKELEKLLRKDSNHLIDELQEKKKIKHEKKKSKKEKKQKKEKKKKHKKKYSQEDSIQIVPQQIVVRQDSPSIDSKSNRIECELQMDSLSDHLSKYPQDEIQLSSPSPIPEIHQQQLPPPQPQEPIRQRNHNWPRNLIHGILQGNKNQQRR